MRILGLDYGSKRVGVALSDESAQVAFPQAVWANDGKLLGKIKALCDEKKVGEVIMGDTLTYRGLANLITKEAFRFRANLEKELGLPVTLISETYTSREAVRVVQKDAETDARAAALILQSYLDKRNLK